MKLRAVFLAILALTTGMLAWTPGRADPLVIRALAPTQTVTGTWEDPGSPGAGSATLTFSVAVTVAALRSAAGGLSLGAAVGSIDYMLDRNGSTVASATAIPLYGGFSHAHPDHVQVDMLTVDTNGILVQWYFLIDRDGAGLEVLLWSGIDPFGALPIVGVPCPSACPTALHRLRGPGSIEVTTIV